MRTLREQIQGALLDVLQAMIKRWRRRRSSPIWTLTVVPAMRSAATIESTPATATGAESGMPDVGPIDLATPKLGSVRTLRDRPLRCLGSLFIGIQSDCLLL
jgi:hypothetical protein